MDASAESLLRQGRPEEALQQLTAEVRQHPADAKRRVFLFQLLSLLGQWERAQHQLVVSGELDGLNSLLVGAYSAALKGELTRGAVFRGEATPTVIGEPDAWLALLLQAIRHTAEGHHVQAARLRNEAFEQAPASKGHVDGAAFQWLADADTRIGPCLEVIVSGGYAWVPFARIKSLVFEAPSDLRDKVWAPVQLTLANGGQMVGFVPARYPDTERSGDNDLLMARKTEWNDVGEETFLGIGQRMFVSDAGDYSLLDIRQIDFES
ncbi:type VI secretion system accessory protein TagJ [Dyella japonica]|uniref:Virulence protein SciE type n=1 Tax=Dyella japonica A8 TaxID=1217721 RepID=A0A075K7V9_9GAMM|nr:type VI secretion system accessory protein TagJ [Dyella japonica]AIF48238.1 virulence protein SciE type [Dyella japonica A8]